MKGYQALDAKRAGEQSVWSEERPALSGHLPCNLALRI